MLLSMRNRKFFIATLSVIIVILLIGDPTDSGRAAFSSQRERIVARLKGRAPRAFEKKKKRYDQPAEAQAFARLKRAPDGQSAIPVERYLVAAERVKRMPRYSTASRSFMPSESELGPQAAGALALGPWESLGPGNVGGRTRALLVDPRNPNVMYAAGVSGGVWRTNDGGASWEALDDLLPTLAINTMAMDPSNPDVIYAGTGEGFFNLDAVRGAGIFKTNNGGTSWVHLAALNGADFHYVNDIVVSPNNSQRIYAATGTGVWRTTDGGINWARIHDPKVNGGCLDLAVRTDQTTDYLFASCGTFEKATVWRKTNAEATGTWTSVLSETGMGRTSLAISPSDQNVIYALMASITPGRFDDGLLAVFRSTTSGEKGSWQARVRNTSPTKLNTVLLTNPIFAFFTECGFRGTNSYFNQGWYDNVIAVDPTDSNRVWVGGIDLFRSDDGGATWGLASYWWADTSPQYAHADHHVIAFHPQYNGTTNQTLFVGNDGGVFKTTNARAATAKGTRAACTASSSSVTWTSLNNGYNVTQFYHGLPYPDGMTYFGGTQDNGTLRGSDAAGPNNWTEINGGDGGYVAVNPANTNILYTETTGMSIEKSINGGVDFADATKGITEADANFLFITPFIMDPSNAQRLWTGGKVLWRTIDSAANWVQASATVKAGSVSAIAVAQRNGNRVVAGTSEGFIHRTDSGLSATKATVWPSVQPRKGYISWVAFDPTNVNIVYATYASFNSKTTDRHIYKSTNGGATWTPIDGVGGTGIPDIPVHCIVVDPLFTNRLYVGTDLGVFVSLDGGAKWARETTGFANVVTESLAVNTVDGVTTLFAFTHGRGAWKVVLSQ
jgi:photosystem II stability/assembly factor-like uncharacterized protein